MYVGLPWGIGRGFLDVNGGTEVHNVCRKMNRKLMSNIAVIILLRFI